MKKIALMVLFFSIVAAGCTKKIPTQDLDVFAQCLTDQGAIMYGSVTCTHCLSQKAMFGDSFAKINYVECSKEFEKCADLKGVPTWKFKDGTQLLGLQELSALAEKTDCLLP